jgi:hypothetical protein
MLLGTICLVLSKKTFSAQHSKHLIFQQCPRALSGIPERLETVEKLDLVSKLFYLQCRDS